MRSRPPAAHPVSLAVQDLNLRRQFPGFRYRLEGGEGIWRGMLQPRQVSPIYRVEVRYRTGKVPTVRVLNPKIAPGAPHVYGNGALCLYWPKESPWRQDRLVADTILPWTALWLLYYELWLDTGKWLGPSSHDPKSVAREAPE